MAWFDLIWMPKRNGSDKKTKSISISKIWFLYLFRSVDINNAENTLTHCFEALAWQHFHHTAFLVCFVLFHMFHMLNYFQQHTTHKFINTCPVRYCKPFSFIILSSLIGMKFFESPSCQTWKERLLLKDKFCIRNL